MIGPVNDPKSSLRPFTVEKNLFGWNIQISTAACCLLSTYRIMSTRNRPRIQANLSIMYDSRLSSPRRQWCLVLLLAFTCTVTIAFTQARVPSTTARWGNNQQSTVSDRAAFFLAQTPLPPRGGGSRLKPRAATRVPSSSTSPSKAGEASFDDESGLSSSSHSFVEDPSKVRQSRPDDDDAWQGCSNRQLKLPWSPCLFSWIIV